MDLDKRKSTQHMHGIVKLLKHKQAYWVPTTLFVLALVWSPTSILASPKSDIFGFILLSRRILLALMSLWMILSLESWWR